MRIQRKVVIGGVLIVMISAVIYANISGSGVSALTAGGAIPVEVKKIESGTIQSRVMADGVVEQTERKQIYFESPMKVRQVFVEQFQTVKKGEKLFELDRADLDNQLKQVVADLKIQELQVKKLAMGGAVQTLYEEEYALKSAQETLRSARDKLKTTTTLYNASAVAEDELKQAQKECTEAELGLKNAQDVLDNKRKQNTQNEQTENIDLEIQKQNVTVGKLKVEELQQQIQKLTQAESAPMDGTVTVLNLEEGGMTATGQPSAVISDITALRIRANINAIDINAVVAGQTVEITSDAMGADNKVAGKIEKVSPVINTNNTVLGEEKVFETLIALETGEQNINLLNPGQSVECTIATKSAKEAVICSFDMINDDKDGKKFVYIADPKTNTVKKQYITLGVTSDLDTEVKKGIQKGDLVVVEPPLNLKDQNSIKITNQP